ncbi:hypothetical protein B0H11DRAFT_2225312 [Mycena galericulata]|nr:hypothetical protein B0H11DRAFT_2230751 [Mycena galericulata]KAJ7500923.1 hypothetical protein B0H11DRAFT_2225312 [Mycena galericulata]
MALAGNPPHVVDLQKGEIYHNMDYIFFGALAATPLLFFIRAPFIAYDASFRLKKKTHQTSAPVHRSVPTLTAEELAEIPELVPMEDDHGDDRCGFWLCRRHGVPLRSKL